VLVVDLVSALCVYWGKRVGWEGEEERKGKGMCVSKWWSSVW